MLSTRLEIVRKALHIIGACLIIWLELVSCNLCIWAIAICAVILELLRGSSTKYGMWVRGALRQLGLAQLMRSEEEKAFTGATCMVIAAAICYTFFDRGISTLGFLILACADPAATFVGRAVGRNPIGEGKTLEGSAAFFTVAVLIMVLMSGIIGFDEVFLMIVVASSGAATFAELFAGKFKINDNLAIPLVFVFCTYLLMGMAMV